MQPREAIQHLVQAVLETTNGELNDDATGMCLDWHGGHPGSARLTQAQTTEQRSSQRLCLTGEYAAKSRPDSAETR